MDNFFFLQENQHRSNKHPRINKVHLVTEKKKIPFFLLSCIQISHFVWVRLITTTFVEEIKQRSKNSLFKDFSKIFLPTILRKYFFKNSYFFFRASFLCRKSLTLGKSHWDWGRIFQSNQCDNCSHYFEQIKFYSKKKKLGKGLSLEYGNVIFRKSWFKWIKLRFCSTKVVNSFE